MPLTNVTVPFVPTVYEEMLALRLLVTYANPVIGSTAIQQAAVPPSATCELMGESPLALMLKDDSAPAPPFGMEVAEPKVSVTSRSPLLSKAKPKNVGNAGGSNGVAGACVIFGVPAIPFWSTGKT